MTTSALTLRDLAPMMRDATRPTSFIRWAWKEGFVTSHQRTRLDELATEYHSVSPRPAGDGTESIYVDCFDTALPERCCVCGLEDTDHLPGDGLGHAFRVVVPVATFRVGPSGFVQRIDPPVAA